MGNIVGKNGGKVLKKRKKTEIWKFQKKTVKNGKKNGEPNFIKNICKNASNQCLIYATLQPQVYLGSLTVIREPRFIKN